MQIIHKKSIYPGKVDNWRKVVCGNSTPRDHKVFPPSPKANEIGPFHPIRGLVGEVHLVMLAIRRLAVGLLTAVCHVPWCLRVCPACPACPAFHNQKCATCNPQSTIGKFQESIMYANHVEHGWKIFCDHGWRTLRIMIGRSVWNHGFYLVAMGSWAQWAQGAHGPVYNSRFILSNVKFAIYNSRL